MKRLKGSSDYDIKPKFPNQELGRVNKGEAENQYVLGYQHGLGGFAKGAVELRTAYYKGREDMRQSVRDLLCTYLNKGDSFERQNLIGELLDVINDMKRE